MKRFHVLLAFSLTLTLAGAALAGDTPEEAVAAIDGRCEIKCFTHSCSIECGPGKEPKCVCRRVVQPGGTQVFPFCDCRKALSAAEEADDANRANISKSDGWVTVYSGPAKCKSIKCTGGSVDKGETIGLEVEVDGNSQGSLRKGQEGEFEGKKIRIKALSRIVSYDLNNC